MLNDDENQSSRNSKKEKQKKLVNKYFRISYIYNKKFVANLSKMVSLDYN